MQPEFPWIIYIASYNHKVKSAWKRNSTSKYWLEILKDYTFKEKSSFIIYLPNWIQYLEENIICYI